MRLLIVGLVVAAAGVIITPTDRRLRLLGRLTAHLRRVGAAKLEAALSAAG